MEASQRGVYVSVVLFQSLNSQSKTKQDNPWYANPFHRDNNVNRINGDTNGDGLGDESFTLTIPAITRLIEQALLEVREVERAVPENRAAEAAAELLLVHRQRRAGQRVGRIEAVVAQKP